MGQCKVQPGSEPGPVYDQKNGKGAMMGYNPIYFGF